jgi:hypothetical protein
MSLGRRKGGNPNGRCNWAVGIFDTTSAAIEDQSVIPTLNDAIADFTSRQGRKTMGATIENRTRTAFPVSE